jgi:hypothetical protein
MVFFLLIVMVVFASFVIILSQNTGLEQVTINAKQLDLDRYTELQTVSVTNPETAVLNNVVYITVVLRTMARFPLNSCDYGLKTLHRTQLVANINISTNYPSTRAPVFNYFNFKLKF